MEICENKVKNSKIWKKLFVYCKYHRYLYFRCYFLQASKEKLRNVGRGQEKFLRKGYHTIDKM